MLILSRKIGESIVIDGRIVVRVMRLEGDVVKLGIDAPREVPVHRQEVYLEIQKNNQEALSVQSPKLPRLVPPPAANWPEGAKSPFNKNRPPPTDWPAK